MPEWILYGMQYVHLGIGLLLLVSPEWRRPGLIMSGFALFYIGISPFNNALIAYDAGLHKAIFMNVDVLAATLIFFLCYPSPKNTSYRQKHWLSLTTILTLFWITQYLNYRYAEGLPISIAELHYEVLVVVWALLQAIIPGPAAWEMGNELKEMVPKILARRSFGDSFRSWKNSHRRGRENRAREGWINSRGCATLLAHYRAHRSEAKS